MGVGDDLCIQGQPPRKFEVDLLLVLAVDHQVSLVGDAGRRFVGGRTAARLFATVPHGGHSLAANFNDKINYPERTFTKINLRMMYFLKIKSSLPAPPIPWVVIFGWILATHNT